MEKRSTDGYIFLGTAVRYLMDIDEGDRVFGEGAIDENILHLRTGLANYEFLVTWRLSQSLESLRTKWHLELAQSESSADLRENRAVTAQERSDLRSAAQNVRATMLAEAEGKLAYIAEDKRYSVQILIDDVSKLMAQGVFQALPEIAKFDFNEAGKALAFDLPTAAAFHILRGTESVLRDSYERLVRRNRIPEPRMWYAMVSDLRTKSNGPAALVLDNLDSLRKHFRNPTQHPEKTYDSDEAQDLLALAIDSINRLGNHLHDKGL